MAHNSKIRDRWGPYLGQALIMVVCGAWIVFGVMAITGTFPLADDYFEHLEFRLNVGSEELSDIPPMAQQPPGMARAAGVAFSPTVARPRSLAVTARANGAPQ